MGVSTRGLFGAVARFAAPPADSDADLLDRYVRAGDEAAFADIVRRHGPMVMAVCRRRLGRDADADDAFQAVFLALAKSAAVVRSRAALAGWLYRAAYLIALKAAGRRARLPAALPAEVPMPDPPPPTWEAAEFRAIVDAEVANLPDRLRAAAVLCLLEGRTNAEAAAVLGVPVGTIDSRLHAARKTLQAKLTRRGVAVVGAGITLEQMLGGPVAAAGPRLLSLIASTVPAVLAEAARPGAGAVPLATADLAHGVIAMTTSNLRTLAVLGVALGALGTAGAGVYLGAAPQPPAPDAPQTAAKAAPAPAATPQDAPAGKLQAKGVKGTAAALDEVFNDDGRDLAHTPFSELFAQIEKQTGLTVRVDVAAFRRLGEPMTENGLFDATMLKDAILGDQFRLLLRGGVPTRDVLSDMLAQVPLKTPCTYQVRGNQLVIVPGFRPPLRPGLNPLAPVQDDDAPVVEPRVVHEQIYGGVVTVAADGKALTDILTDLRRQTGANIVLDPRCAEKAAAGNKLTVALGDVRLYDALRVIADMAQLKMVYAGNIYYVTTPENALEFQPLPPRPGP